MPEHLKSAPESDQFQQYLRTFIKKKERQHRTKVIKEVASSIALMLAG